MQLVEALDSHIDTLMTWFGDERSIKTWGGPPFRYPFSAQTFREDLRLGDVHSFALMADAQEMLGFGQTYLKVGRGHLARIAVSPAHRGRGYGSILVEQLVDKATDKFSCTEHSLYVYTDNLAARRCYEKVGFRESAPPGQDEQHKNVCFMVRPKPLR